MPQKVNPREQIEIASNSFEAAIEFLNGKNYSALNNALLSLLREAKRESCRLLSSMEDLTLSSFSVRNLFEIYLVSKHIYSNEQALISWYGQSHKDSKEVRNGAIKLMKNKGLSTVELELIQELEDDSLEQSPFESKGSFQIRQLAEDYGCLDDYQFIYKLSSKLVHPSSMKIMAYDVLTENGNYLGIVHQVGAYFTREFGIFLQAVLNESA